MLYVTSRDYIFFNSGDPSTLTQLREGTDCKLYIVKLENH